VEAEARGGGGHGLFIGAGNGKLGCACGGSG
jgi:hypothetical protein